MPPIWFFFAGGFGFILILCGWLLHLFLMVVVVEGRSMSPTLEPGDRVIAVRHWPARWLRRGDIVLVWPWHVPSSGARFPEVRPFIKRVVGLSGEVFPPTGNDANTNNGLFYPNTDGQFQQRTWYIPAGALFVCGDNRSDSLDSRRWGPLPLKNVLGVVVRKLPRKVAPSLSSGAMLQAFRSPLELPIGQGAPAFVAQTLQGESVTLATYKGRSVVFVFFAPSNSCCNAITLCLSLAPKAAEIGITLILVSCTGDGPTRLFVDEFGISLPVLVAPRSSNRFLKEYHVSSTPAYCFINEQAIVQSGGPLNMRWGPWKELAESWAGRELSIPNDEF